MQSVLRILPCENIHLRSYNIYAKDVFTLMECIISHVITLTLIQTSNKD